MIASLLLGMCIFPSGHSAAAARLADIEAANIERRSVTVGDATTSGKTTYPLAWDAEVYLDDVPTTFEKLAAGQKKITVLRQLDGLIVEIRGVSHE